MKQMLEDFFLNSDVLVTLIHCGLIILFLFVLDRVICGIISRYVQREQKAGVNNRKITVQNVLKNIIHYVLVFIALVMILSELGINIMSVLAAAGVLGLAVSFGAQSLIKDVLAGFFIIFENQYAVGEYVKINQQFIGTVTEITLRTTSVTGDDGEIATVANGTVTDVINYCRNNIRLKLTFEVAYDTDFDRALSVLETAAKEFYEANLDRMDKNKPPHVNGADAVNESGIALCLFVYSPIEKQFALARDIKLAMVKALQAADIEIPYPVTEVITREDA